MSLALSLVLVLALAHAGPAMQIRANGARRVQYLLDHYLLEINRDELEVLSHRNLKIRAMGAKTELPHSCMYEGRWYTDGATVRTREACLQCMCARGALSCRRRSCAHLPEPPPKCHILHRRGECCPELHCPEGIRLLEHGASARLENDIMVPASIGHACVEGGTVYAAGSAMSTGTACEQCFCLGGTRRCVRPQCLPPPPGCRPRPAPGACCPQRYYCEHVSTMPPDQRNPHDCKTPDGRWVSEGERVPSEVDPKCTQCFCLRGAVRCQHLSCAPPLLGCLPLVQPGQCCPHQYLCDHSKIGTMKAKVQNLWSNHLLPTRNEDRALHTSKSTKLETTAQSATSSTPEKTTSSSVTTKKETEATLKMKRKTEESSHDSVTQNPIEVEAKAIQTTIKTTIAIVETTAATTTETEQTTTEQPEGSVKIMINGTINCTAELSSTSQPLNTTNSNITEIIKIEALPRIPLIDTSDIEFHTFSPNDIITEASGIFDENESFTINVTSSLMANTTKLTSITSTTSAPKTVPPALLETLNISKKTKDDYDYDYAEPTLPPSLPNLKIIPFVAADAVVDEDISSKESLTYPALEREDKFPVYYPNVDTKDTFSDIVTHREEVYHPTQYPIFVSKKAEPQYPSLTHDVELNAGYPGITNDLSTSLHEYTVTASLGNHIPETSKAETKLPSTNSNYELESPALNLFSPPVETEGGFIPKDPAIIDDYYSVYPSTPSPGLVVPHLTTSMQLDSTKGECILTDGRRLIEGESTTLACSVCTCLWGELHCSPRACHTPPRCTRRAVPPGDTCCGELVCDTSNITTTMAPLMTTKKFERLDESKINVTTQPDIILSGFAVPSEPSTLNSTTVGSPVTETNKIAQEVNLSITKDKEFKKEEVTITYSSTTEKLLTTSTTQQPLINHNDTNSNSQEYDDEDEEEFSFGSVLKLLLSDSYDTTTTTATPQYKIKSTEAAPKTTTPPTTRKPKPTLEPFIPVTHHPIHPYIPTKKLNPQNTVNRIDHLVLGEATAIRKTTLRPPPSPFKPMSTTKKIITTTRPVTQKTTTKAAEITKVDTVTVNEVPRAPSPNVVGGVAPGLLKLAGCNIYGRMYRVGRIIAELSTPCQECRCTELGVQCRPLNC